MIKTLLNPFEKYSEIRLFVFGIAALIAGSLAAYWANGRYDGAIDFHIVKSVQLHEPFIDNTINTFSFFLFVFILAKYINSKTRVIDILNTALIARIPVYLLPLTNMGNFISDITNKIDPAHPEKLAADFWGMLILLLFAAFAITVLIWLIILLYNGFKTACNSKQNIHILYFAIALILAEALSSYLVSIINQ